MPLLFFQNIQSQSLPIIIDSQFDDWSANATELLDAAGDGGNIDLLRMQVANDENHLFLKLEIAAEINLTDNHRLTLYLDTDQNSATGTFFNGIGADLEVRFGDRDAFYKLPSGQGQMSLNDLVFRHQPTVTSTVFEMAFDLSAVSNAGFDLFTSNGVSMVWKDQSLAAGDAMPDNGSVFTYTFDGTPTSPINLIDLSKSPSKSVRLLTWNTLSNGLDDLDRAPFFTKILALLQPDIVTFNECWEINEFQVASFMNAAVPLGNFQNWNAVKLDDGNVTASRFPILQNWSVLPGQRLTASLIDIPTVISPTDLLVVNGHLRCCGANFDRQREADAFVKFILDAKTPGGVIDLPEGTPFLLSGDLNLVGDRQQLTTLMTGEIVNTSQFGQGGPMDWDGADLMDVISRQTDDRFAYTWRNDFSSFPPSRIDYHIISGSVASVEKTFTLQTESMSVERLNMFGLSASDARNASDHLPKILDLLLPFPLPVADYDKTVHLTAFPNPTNGFCQIEFEMASRSEVTISLENTNGAEMDRWNRTFPSGRQSMQLDMAHFPTGMYFLKIIMPDRAAILKLAKQ